MLPDAAGPATPTGFAGHAGVGDDDEGKSRGATAATTAWRRMTRGAGSTTVARPPKDAAAMGTMSATGTPPDGPRSDMITPT